MCGQSMTDEEFDRIFGVTPTLAPKKTAKKKTSRGKPAAKRRRAKVKSSVKRKRRA